MIILSAALDLVGPSVPKGVVLLADVFPSFLVKLVIPYLIQAVPYSTRILAVVTISICGMLLVVLTPESRDRGTITVKMLGVSMAAIASGVGELSFLALTHYYGHFSLAAWGSGTGGAGLIGAGLYVLATTTFGLSPHFTLLLSSAFPLVMLVSFFAVLPREPLKAFGSNAGYTAVAADDDAEDTARAAGQEGGDADQSNQYITSPTDEPPVPHAASMLLTRQSAWANFKTNLRRARALFIPYMVPLLLVYISEYTINQGVAPDLLFPLGRTPFRAYRDFYPTYNAIYQVGVFISRSSTPFVRIHALYTPAVLQFVNLLLLTAHAMFDFLPSVWVVFLVVFWEGLLGGLVYVSTFAEISDNVPKEEREFCLSVTTVSDSAGICIAGFIGMVFEVWLCDWQVARGRPYCKME